MSFTSHVDRMQRNRDAILDLLLGPRDDKGKRWLPLSDRVIRDLVRRGQHLPSDAYRTNSMPEHVSGGAGHVVEDEDGTRATVTLTSVEAQVNAEMFGRTVFDNVGAALKRIDSELAIAAAAARKADLARNYVEKVAAKMLGREGVDLCAECNKPIVGMRTKRLDGEAYHHPEDQAATAELLGDEGDDSEGRCWWKAYNAKRGRRAS